MPRAGRICPSLDTSVTFINADMLRVNRSPVCGFIAVAAQRSHRNCKISDQIPSQNFPSARLVFHSCYATVLRAADARYDVRGYVLSELVSLCLGNRATVPLVYRAHYERYAQKEAIAFVESFTAQLFFRAGRFSPHEYRYRPGAPAPPVGNHQPEPRMTAFRVLALSSPFPNRCWSLNHHCFMRRRHEILMTGEQVFGNRELAEAWFTKPAIGLGRRLPCMLLKTNNGYTELAEFLVRLDYGVY